MPTETQRGVVQWIDCERLHQIGVTRLPSVHQSLLYVKVDGEITTITLLSDEARTAILEALQLAPVSGGEVEGPLPYERLEKAAAVIATDFDQDAFVVAERALVASGYPARVKELEDENERLRARLKRWNDLDLAGANE